MPNILVVTDPELSNDVLFDRLSQLPREGVKVFLEHYLAPTSASDSTSFTDLLHEEQAALGKLAAPLLEAGYDVKTRVRVFTKLYETIVQSAIEYEADYVFKPLRHHSPLRRMLYSATDWNLVRFCPCPLLLVSTEPHINQRPVLAALDLESKDEEHEALNEVVLERGKRIAQLIGSDLHLVNAYNLLTVTGSNAARDPLGYSVVKGMREEFLAKAAAIANERKIPIAHLHISEGAPEMVVNATAKEINAGMIVVGSVARHGVSGLFIGNTAESVMESSHCDVFVVKSPDFKTPIKALH